jgi:hypothetical protein
LPAGALQHSRLVAKLQEHFWGIIFWGEHSLRRRQVYYICRKRQSHDFFMHVVCARPPELIQRLHLWACNRLFPDRIPISRLSCPLEGLSPPRCGRCTAKHEVHPVALPQCSHCDDPTCPRIISGAGTRRSPSLTF